MNALDMVALSRLMEITVGRPEVIVGLIDGPVFMKDKNVWSENVVQGKSGNALCSSCALPESAACGHGTFVASLLSARRGTAAPAICPGCTLLVNPIFPESISGVESMPTASPEQLATAIVETVNAGAHLLNLSVGLWPPSSRDQRMLQLALDHAAQRGAIAVVASGNQKSIGSSTMTRHPCAIPVVGCDEKGMPTAESNLGHSIGRLGLRAPGTAITGFGSDGNPRSLEGTSIATPFVTGAVALLWSEFPNASSTDIRYAVQRSSRIGRIAVVPPLLNAWAAYESLSATARSA